MFTAFAALLLALAVADAAHAEKRVALVIGNSAYTNTGPLANPRGDAELMTETLQAVGFEVTKLIDADQAAMKRAMLDFGRKLREGADASLFYYAGHGVQVKGENYLIPVDANIADEGEVDLQGINVNDFLGVMEGTPSKVNIVVLDACRNNPFARSFRSQSRGLAMVDAPRGTYIAYATAPGDVAADGDTGHSPYTKALAEAIIQPGLKLEDTFKQARRMVIEATNEKQVPWETTSLTGDFYFVPGDAEVAAVSPAPAPVPAPESAPDAIKPSEAPLSIGTSHDPAILSAYLARFPNGPSARVARNRLAALGLQIETPARKSPATIDTAKDAVEAWAAIGVSHNRALLEAFLKRFPNSPFARSARNRLAALGLPARVAEPFVRAMGKLDVPQTYLADLDSGIIAEKGADLWFEAVTGDEQYLVPQNGAAMAVGDGAKRDFSACSAADYTADRVALGDLPVGTFVCLRTDEGRIASFRIDAVWGAAPRTLSINYAVWD